MKRETNRKSGNSRAIFSKGSTSRIPHGLTYLACTGLAILVIGHAQAASVFTEAAVTEGENTSFNYVIDFDSETSGSFASASISGGSTHALEPAGGNGDLVFTGEASAEASYQALRVAASGSLTNTFYDANYDNNSRTGVPTSYIANATARFDEILSYGSTATNYTSIYIFRVSGQVSGTAGGTLVIDLNHGSQARETSYIRDNGTYSFDLYSAAYQHGISPQQFRLQIQALEFFTMDPGIPEGLNLSGEINFSNTVEFLGVDLRDQNGVLQPQGTITSDSGRTVNIIAVPEPGSIVLLLLGASCVLWKFRRKISLSQD